MKLFITEALLAAGVEELTKAIAADPASAAADILIVVAENKELQEGFDALTKINAELNEQIEAAPAQAEVEVVKPKLSDKTFTVDKTKYGFAFPAVNLEGTIITNEDVLNSKELQKKLVEMESGFIIAL